MTFWAQAHLHCPPTLPLAAGSAMRQLQAALTARGLHTTVHPGLSGLSVLLSSGPLDIGGLFPVLPLPPAGAETYRIDVGSQGACRWVAVCGSDFNGLAYALQELAAQVQLANDIDPLGAVKSCSRSPLLEVRAVNVFTVNAALERPWLYDRSHWESYFELLARSRFNGLTLTLGNHSPLFAPPFPFLIEVPGYEQVRPISGGPGQRQANLEMLRMVSGLARQWGIRFTLAMWQQHVHRYGTNQVEGLAYEDLFGYCPRALALLLAACIDIEGVQFRMNYESGIRPEDQERFFRSMFEAIRDSGRPIRVELRAKGLNTSTIEAAREILGEVTVSTKYWHEHMGLPYHGTQIIPQDLRNYRRYGYWDLLPKTRPYRVLYQLWSHGTQRVLSWADPDHAGRFAQSCRLGDGEGFEMAAPLSHKGFGDFVSPPWRVFADPAREHYTWEFERYWPFFMALGLAGYSGSEDTGVYRAQWLRFGCENGPLLERALAAASQCLPLVTAFHCKSSSVFGYWPEMDAGGTTDVYINVPTGDPGRISAIAEYVREVMEQKPSGRLTPPQVALRLLELAAQIDHELAVIRSMPTSDNLAREMHSLETDCRILAALARYHAARIESGLQYAFFRASGEAKALRRCVAAMAEAVDHWRHLATLAELYHDGLSFGVFGPPHVGHWKDDLPLLGHDLDRLRSLEQRWMVATQTPQELPAAAVEQPWYELKTVWAVEDGRARRRLGERVAAAPLTWPVYEGAAAASVLQEPVAIVQEVLAILGTPAAAAGEAGYARFQTCRSAHPPVIDHQPVAQWRAGQDLPISVTARGHAPPVTIRLHYRLLNQALPWQVVPMTTPDGLHFSATIPGPFITADWDLMYAIEAVDGSMAGVFYPDLFIGEPFCVVQVRV